MGDVVEQLARPANGFRSPFKISKVHASRDVESYRNLELNNPFISLYDILYINMSEHTKMDPHI